MLAADVDRAAVIGIGNALGAVDQAANLVRRAGDVLLRCKTHLEVVREGVEDREVAVDVAILPRQLAACANGLDGVGPGKPGGDVQGVDVLLDDDIAAEPLVWYQKRRRSSGVVAARSSCTVADQG